MVPPPRDPTRLPRLLRAWTNLTADDGATGRYVDNMLNAKITAPIDFNYFDDELMHFPYLQWLVMSQAANASQFVSATQTCIDSLQRTHDVVKPYRSDMW
jgi:hypothetical protein